MSPGDEEFLRAAAAAGALPAETLAEVAAAHRRAEAFFGRSVPLDAFLLQQRWANADALERAVADAHRRVRVCPHCWTRVNVFPLPPAELFCCGGCQKMVAAPLDPHADLLAPDVEAAQTVPWHGARNVPRTLARLGLEGASEVGFGATGVVHRATLRPRGTIVAVKILHADLGADPRAVGRFLREARAAAAIDHPNVVPVRHAAFTSAFPFLVLDWVDGEDLRSALDARGALPVERALALAADVARGLAAVHAAGLVHRDVKPSNVLVPPVGAARLTDFGLARAAASESLALTRTGEMVGTLQYMPPEQWRDARRATPMSDVYALGASLFHLLTGRAPFGDAGWAEIAVRLDAGTVPRLEDAAPGLPADLRALVARLMAVDPGKRPPDGAQALREIEGLRPG